MPVPRTIIAHGLGLLVCVSAIEGGLYLFAQRAGTLHDLDRRVKFVEDSIASGAHSSDVIILGDSTGYLGADPATFSGIAGVSSFNFASAISIAPIADRQFLEQYFRHARLPKRSCWPG